uniref:Uncharacterized protein n=1 Tax=Oryza sativa subsp. japonica TaxID=39947 RepID=Q7XD72_ORYSJ|nr:hypothetical protein LOC_Os10g34690 [Oryza sativa Japonica Group]
MASWRCANGLSEQCCPTFDPEKSWRMPQDNWIRLGDEDGWGMRP